jgi:hypothetical protein
MTSQMKLFDHAGIIHLHSVYSFDGRTSIPDIISAANKNQVKFLFLTDHSTLQARKEGFEGWHKGTLLIVGEEIAPRFNHYLAFQEGESIEALENVQNERPQVYVDSVRNRGGIGFIAHPDHEGAALFHVKHYPWIDWSVNGYTGMGIWDFMTDWQNSLTGYFCAVLSYAFPALFLRGPSTATLKRWDLLTQERRIVGIGELDNHDTLRRILGFNLSIFPYTRVFRLIRTHLLTPTPLSGNYRSDISVLFNALRNGRAYIALDYYRSSSGFSFNMSEDERCATMGEEFIIHRFANLSVSVPCPASIRIIRNGDLFMTVTANELSTAIREPGVYRIEVYLKVYGRYRPWIFSNPVYVMK